MRRFVSAGALLVWALACGGTGPIDAGSGQTGPLDAGASQTPGDAGNTTAGDGGQQNTSVSLVVHVSGHGRVLSSPSGVDCHADCTAQFALRSTVTLSAVADAGQMLVSFGGACDGSACTLTLDADTHVTAAFAAQPPPSPQFNVLTVEMAGTGAGRVVSKPAGIDCNGVRSCAATFPAGTEVSLAAMPDQLSRSATWTGPCAGPSCVVTLGRDVAVRANFGQLRYRAVDLGVLPGGSWSAGRSISANGRFIAGTWGGIEQPFFWDGAMHDLGIKQGNVVAVTDLGALAGNSTPDGGRTNTAYTWQAGLLRMLPAFGGGNATVATGINIRGVVVGWAIPASGPSRAVSWGAAGVTDLGSLEIGALATSAAYGINSHNVIVGESVAHGGGTAVRFRDGVIEELGTLGGQWSRANAINDAGVIVGQAEYDASRVYHGFFHVGGRMIDIGALPGREYTFLWGVNSAGIAVGGASPQGGEIHGIVAIPDRIVDLNGLVDNTAAVIGAAEGIDDSGNIVTYAAHRAVLLVPQR